MVYAPTGAAPLTTMPPSGLWSPTVFSNATPDAFAPGGSNCYFWPTAAPLPLYPASPAGSVGTGPYSVR
jgi:hypothetical protein